MTDDRQGSDKLEEHSSLGKFWVPFPGSEFQEVPVSFDTDVRMFVRSYRLLP